MRKKPFLAALLSLISYLLFSFFVGRRYLDGFDLSATTFLRNAINPILDFPLSLFSLLGSFEISTLILFIIIIKLIPKNLRLTILIYYFAILGLEFLGKTTIFHPNPPPKFFRYDIPIFFPSAYVSTSYSYPSGHAARTAFISLLAVMTVIRNSPFPRLLISQYLGIFFILLLDFLMFISRPYLGEHWSTDVLGGAILGFSASLFVLSIPPKPQNLQKDL